MLIFKHFRLTLFDTGPGKCFYPLSYLHYIYGCRLSKLQISCVAKKRDGLKNVEKKMSERFIAPFLVGPLTFQSRAVGTGWGAVGPPPQDFVRSVNYVYHNQEGTYYAHHITTRPPDFQTFLRPCY